MDSIKTIISQFLLEESEKALSSINKAEGLVDLPDGEYNGTWKGWIVNLGFPYEDEDRRFEEVTFKTKDVGLKSMFPIPFIVTIKDKRVVEMVRDESTEEERIERNMWKNRYDENIDLPDGDYEGLQSGYEVVIPSRDDFKFETKHGIRGINFKILVRVKDKKAILLNNYSGKFTKEKNK